MRAPRSGCCGPVFLARRHQAGHFGFRRSRALLRPPFGEGDVLDDIVGVRQALCLGDVLNDSSFWRSLRSWSQAMDRPAATAAWSLPLRPGRSAPAQ